MSDGVDYTRMTADGPGDDLMSDPLLKALKRIIPYHEIWNDPVKTKEFYDGLLAAMNTGPGEAKDTEPEEESRLEQGRARGQKFRTDRKIPQGESGKARDMEFLDDPESWNSSRKL